MNQPSTFARCPSRTVGLTLPVSARDTWSTTVRVAILKAGFGIRYRLLVLSFGHILGSMKTYSDDMGERALLSTMQSFGHVTVWPQFVIYSNGSELSDNRIKEFTYCVDHPEPLLFSASGRSAILLIRLDQILAELNNQRSNVQASTSPAAVWFGAKQRMALAGSAMLHCVWSVPICLSKSSGDGEMFSAASPSTAPLKTDARAASKSSCSVSEFRITQLR